MAKNLEEQIKDRQEQASQKRIFAKAKLVAEKLGQVDFKQGGFGTGDLRHVFNDKASSLVIQHNVSTFRDPDGDVETRNVKITYKGEEVFRAGGYGAESVYAYAPGAWEKKLETLHPAAQEKVHQEQDASAKIKALKEAAAEKAKRMQWGL